MGNQLRGDQLGRPSQQKEKLSGDKARKKKKRIGRRKKKNVKTKLRKDQLIRSVGTR